MLHFPLCRESVLGMPRIEIEFEFDMGLNGVFAGRKGHSVGFVMRRLILVCLTCVSNIDFCYFEAFYFLKLPEKARVFIYPCTCMLVSVYYDKLQTSNNTHLYLSRRSTRLTVLIKPLSRPKGRRKGGIFCAERLRGHLRG